MGNRSSREVSSAAPKTTSGIVVSRPIPISTQLTSPPILAAPTRAMTLSSDITASAMMMILIACHALCPAWIFSSPSSASSCTSFQAIQINKSPPATCKKGISSRKEMMPAKMSRSATAPAAPQMIACRRWLPWRLRAAMAMTTALSPERIRLTASTLTSASKKTALRNSSNNVCPSSVPPYRRKPSSHLLVRFSPSPSYQLLRAAIDPTSQDGDQRHHEEHGVEHPPDEQVLALDGLFSPDQQVEVRSAYERQHRRQGVEQVEAPRGEHESQSHRHRALEDHGPGYVPEGQGVLVAPDPDHGVELLGELRGQGRKHERYEAGRQPHRLGEMLDGGNEEVGPDAHNRHRPQHLRRHGPERGLGPRRPEGQLLGRVLDALPAGLYGAPDVDAVRDDEDDGQDHLQDKWHGHDPGTRAQGEEDEEEDHVPPGCPLVYRDVVVALPAAPVDLYRDPDDEQGDRGQEERRPEDRADAYLPGGRVAGEDDRDDGDHGDHGLRQRGAHGREHAPDGSLIQVQPVAEYLDGVGEEGCGHDYHDS